MKKILLLSCIFAVHTGFSQKTDDHDHGQFYQGTEISEVLDLNINESTDLALLVKNHLELPNHIQLVHSKSIQSLTAMHHHYILKSNNVEIYDATVHAVVGNDGNFRKLIHNATPYVISETEYSFPSSLAQSLKDEYSADEIAEEENLWLPQNGQLVAAKRVVLVSHNTLHKEIIYTDAGVQYEIEKIKYHHVHGPNDTLISGMVFEPDPLTSAQVDYGSPYVDNGDAAVTVLDNERVSRQFIATYNNGTFELANDFVEIREMSAPVIFPITSSSNQFDYTRNQAAFEDVNTFYHLTNHKLHMDALGFTSLPGYVLPADPHALNGDDNSAFVTSQVPFRLLFGEGGVDDAEDADVIIHEMTHAYVLAASNNNNGIVERDCLEEALGDYFAASYSRSINNYNQHQVFSWDGHNEFWSGREVESTKDYLQTTFGGNIYAHTDLFCSPLMEAYGIIGRNTMDKIVMEAIHVLGSNTTFSQMAMHIIDADYFLNGGVNFATLKAAFVRRNILDANYFTVNEIPHSSDLKLYGTYEFSKGGELILETKDHNITSYKLININGALVQAVTIEELKHQISIGSSDLKSGIYVLEVELNNGLKQAFKVSRL